MASLFGSQALHRDRGSTSKICLGFDCGLKTADFAPLWPVIDSRRGAARACIRAASCRHVHVCNPYPPHARCAKPVGRRRMQLHVDQSTRPSRASPNFAKTRAGPQVVGNVESCKSSNGKRLDAKRELQPTQARKYIEIDCSIFDREQES